MRSQASVSVSPVSGSLDELRSNETVSGTPPVVGLAVMRAVGG
jgi:hypothetical protein